MHAANQIQMDKGLTPRQGKENHLDQPMIMERKPAQKAQNAYPDESIFGLVHNNQSDNLPKA